MRVFISKNVTQNSFSWLKLQIYISVINTFTKKNKWRRSKPILKPLLIAMNFLAFALKFLLVRITAYLRINIKHLRRISSPILLLGASIYWTKHFYSSLTYYFSVYQGIGWNTPSRVWFITSRCLDIRWKTPSPVWFTIYFLMFGYQMKHSFSYLIYYFSPVQKFYRDLAEINEISMRSLSSRRDL